MGLGPLQIKVPHILLLGLKLLPVFSVIGRVTPKEGPVIFICIIRSIEVELSNGTSKFFPVDELNRADDNVFAEENSEVLGFVTLGYHIIVL